MKRLNTHSLKGRLILSLLAALVFTLGGISVFSFIVTQHESDEIFDARLATSARVLDVLVAQKVSTATLNHPIVIELPQELEKLPEQEKFPSGHRYENKMAFQIWSADYRLLVRSASAPETPFANLSAGFSTSKMQQHTWEVFTLKSQNTWVQVAEDTTIRNELADDLSYTLTAPLILSAIFLLFLSYHLISKALKPLENLSSQLDNKGPESLDEISLINPPKEIFTVLTAINLLLKRIQESRDREIRFTDAAAHELRTPLAAIHLHAENLQLAHGDIEKKQSLELLLKSSERAQRLTEQLLTYSSIQTHNPNKPFQGLEQFEALNIAEIIAEVLEELEPKMNSRHQSFAAHGLDSLSSVKILGNPLKIYRLFSNLIDNASRYGFTKSTIELHVYCEPTHVLFKLSNLSEIIAPVALQYILEPYVRVLGNKTIGSGLGLAIAKTILEQHQGTLTFINSTNNTNTTNNSEQPSEKITEQTKTETTGITTETGTTTIAFQLPIVTRF